ncbi:hypothetical protein A3709_19270 [Halioglobus sp. HI00S01]|uniref:hypothetical protein n=1 Tax=Halioglobus sp. HI00S01 TaxID=1822214 RepID=UPI0007C30954|nr:hypothetical protein [Halioglobus sp. HI00S01]KZX57765.1 hypothetical protein A3709_19270 [Halioglobus sp. HI00S01]
MSKIEYKYSKGAGGEDIDWTLTQDGQWVGYFETETLTVLAMAVVSGVVTVPGELDCFSGQYYGDPDSGDKLYHYEGDDDGDYIINSYLSCGDEDPEEEYKGCMAGRNLARALVLLLSGVVDYDYALIKPLFNDFDDKTEETFDITRNLDPCVEYSFQVTSFGRTFPCTPHAFSQSNAGTDTLISVDGGIGPNSPRIWSASKGWYTDAYADLVASIVRLIDRGADVSPAFIDDALSDELSVYDAVASWFVGTGLEVEVSQDLSGTSGMLDIDITGIGSVRRVVLRTDIQRGDIFNIYYADSSKGGGEWKTDVKSALEAYFAQL